MDNISMHFRGCPYHRLNHPQLITERRHQLALRIQRPQRHLLSCCLYQHLLIDFFFDYLPHLRRQTTIPLLTQGFQLWLDA